MMLEVLEPLMSPERVAKIQQVSPASTRITL